MKHAIQSTINLFILTLFLAVVASCGKVDFSETIEGSGNESFSSVRILTRGASASTDIYPLRIYAFDDDGTLQESQTIHSSAEPIQLTLPTGTDMRIVAMVADESTYSIPDNPTSSSLLTTKEPQLPENTTASTKEQACGYVTSDPLQMGFADICPTAANATVSLQMHYQMSSVNIVLSGLPEECTSAYVSVSSPAYAITMTGELTGSQKTCIPLKYDPNKEEWASGDTYLFPTTGTQTNFTIAYNDNVNEHFAVVCYMSPLKPGIPYILQGTLSTEGSLVISGSVTASQWGEPVNMNFTFSPENSTIVSPDGNSPSNGSGDSETYPTYMVETIPTALSLWDGHIVANVIPDEASPATSAVLQLLSLEDYGNITSAYNAESPTQAADIATSYTEYDLSSWSIPTEDEARELRNAYLDDTALFDNLLTEAKASPIILIDDKGNNIRYLCNEAKSTYSFKPGSSYNSIKEAGAKVATYHLRLIKKVRVKLQ